MVGELDAVGVGEAVKVGVIVPVTMRGVRFGVDD